MSRPTEPAPKRHADAPFRAETDDDVPRRFKPWEKVFGVVAFLVFLAALGFVTWRYADQPITTDVISFKVVSPELTTITVDVSKAPERPARCVLQALSVTSAQVGIAKLEVPAQPNGQRTTRWVVDIPTQELATTAVVQECDLVDTGK